MSPFFKVIGIASLVLGLYAFSYIFGLANGAVISRAEFFMSSFIVGYSALAVTIISFWIAFRIRLKSRE